MGTRKGIPNKNKRNLIRLLQDMYGEEFSPIMKMAEQAQRMHEITLNSTNITDLKQSLDAWDKVANYVEPKLKAVEIKYDDRANNFPTKIELVGVSKS